MEKLAHPKRKRKAWKAPKMLTHYVKLELKEDKKVSHPRVSVSESAARSYLMTRGASMLTLMQSVSGRKNLPASVPGRTQSRMTTPTTRALSSFSWRRQSKMPSGGRPKWLNNAFNESPQSLPQSLFQSVQNFLLRKVNPAGSTSVH